MSKKRKLEYFEWDIKEGLYLCENFTNEEIGKFFFCVMFSCEQLKIQPLETNNTELLKYYNYFYNEYVRPQIGLFRPEHELKNHKEGAVK